MNLKKLLFSVATMALFWYTAWLGGYNFDIRNVWVAYWFIVSVVISVFAYNLAE